MEYAWHDFVGNIGVACILGTYLGLQLGQLAPDSYAYSLVNGLGALLIMVSLFYNFNLSSFVIEIFWLVISTIGLARRFRADRRAQS